MDKFKEKLEHYMRFGLSVKDLKEILDELVENGYGDAAVGYRIGHTNESIPRAVSFPIADILTHEDKQMVLFAPAARINKVKDRKIPEFDMVVSFDDNTMKLNFEEILFA